MTVTQYIGAPYIPHGWTTWQPATAYDGMSVVEYNLVWYIAKQPVPIGTAPTGQSDDPYWAAVDRWNGQVEEYQQQVEEYKETVEKNYGRNYLLNKKILFIGDSYGAGAGKWPDFFTNFLRLKPENVNNACVSATGFLVNGVNGFLDQVNNAPADGNYTDIIIAGGLNDSTFDNISFALRDQIALTLNTIRQKYPNANVYLSYIGNARDNSEYIMGRTYDKRTFAKFIYEHSNCTILYNCVNALNQASALKDDGIHPSSSGAEELGKAIAQAWLCSYELDYPVQNFSYVINSSFNHVPWTYEINRGQVTLHIASGVYTNKSGSDIAGNTYVTFGTLNNLYFNKSIEIELGALLNVTGTYKKCNIAFKLTRNLIQFKYLNLVNNAWEPFKSGENINVDINSELRFSCEILGS